jgi:hypothetical protein
MIVALVLVPELVSELVLALVVAQEPDEALAQEPVLGPVRCMRVLVQALALVSGQMMASMQEQRALMVVTQPEDCTRTVRYMTHSLVEVLV